MTDKLICDEGHEVTLVSAPDIRAAKAIAEEAARLLPGFAGVGIEDDADGEYTVAICIEPEYAYSGSDTVEVIQKPFQYG